MSTPRHHDTDRRPFTTATSSHKVHLAAPAILLVCRFLHRDRLLGALCMLNAVAAAILLVVSDARPALPQRASEHSRGPPGNRAVRPRDAPPVRRPRTAGLVGPPTSSLNALVHGAHHHIISLSQYRFYW